MVGSLCASPSSTSSSAVLAERYPEVPNIGDVTKMNWKKYRGKVDLVVGGSPCQSFSIAGKREGLQGESGLMFEYIRAVREIRPRWFLWENVPGALSSENGEAFRQLLSEMDKLGYGLAWRVLDAQFFGVAQRRRRLFLVGHLGACPPSAYSLSWRACGGILNRARKRGRALDRRTLQGHAGGLVQTVRWIAASCVALLVAVVALELYVIRTLAAGLVVLALLACG